MAKLIPVFLVGGCSLIYSSGNIPGRQADAMPDALPIDADPTMLHLLDVAPMDINEGQGDGGSRPVILVIHGQNIVTGAQVTVSGAANVVVDSGNVVVATASDYLAVPVTVHVDPSAGAGTVIGLTVQVTQPGAMPQTIAGPQLHALDELTSPTTTPAALYSKINLSTPWVVAPGAMSAPITLRAVSSLTTADITAKGGNAATINGGLAGPGGCPGAPEAGDAGCLGGGKGGKPGTSGVLGDAGGDGGGAGLATLGASGTGGPFGAGGNMIGDDMISTFAANQPAGGGGGGKNYALLGGTKGSGGGGGAGTIELTAGGDVTCGNITVTGGLGTTSSNGGSGGGGAGGLILLRSGHTLSTMTLTATGGAGGGTAGKGSDGRIRWDNPTGSAPTSTPIAARGPTFAATIPQVVRSTTLSLVGTTGRTVNVFVIDSGGATHAGPQGVDSTATFNAPLQPGFNRVCVVLAAAGSQPQPESQECIDVAYLP